MPNAFAVVTLPATTNLAEDAVVNTFAIATDGSVQASAPGIVNALEAFYNTDRNGGGSSVASFLSARRSRVADACTIDVYDITGKLDGSPHGPPVAGDTFDLNGPSNQGMLPSEVAMVGTILGNSRNVVSVEVPDDADPAPFNDPDTARDRPMQRRTGRVYIGDLNPNASDNLGRPHPGLRVSILSAIAGLSGDLEVAGSSLAVWSRKNRAMYVANGAFVDDAFDTQRRRGLQPTLRTTIAF
jgi:hypothetical protein